MRLANSFRNLVVLSLLTIGLAACGQSPGKPAGAGDKTANSKSNSGDTSTAAQSAQLAHGDPQAVVFNAMQQLRSQKAYRIRSTSVVSISGGQATTSGREFVAPDRTHNIDDGREVIISGKIMYVKKGGEWQNMGTQISDMQEKMSSNSSR